MALPDGFKQRVRHDRIRPDRGLAPASICQSSWPRFHDTDFAPTTHQASSGGIVSARITVDEEKVF
jgi:hypothetical protein